MTHINRIMAYRVATTSFDQNHWPDCDLDSARIELYVVPTCLTCYSKAGQWIDGDHCKLCDLF
jgi:hypothetical protein